MKLISIILILVMTVLVQSKKHRKNQKQYISYEAGVPSQVVANHMRADRQTIQFPGYTHITSFQPFSKLQHIETGPIVDRPLVDTQNTVWAHQTNRANRK